MISKAGLILKSKVGLSVLGVVLVGSGTAAALALTSGHSTTNATGRGSATASNAHTIVVEGTLKGYNAGANTISVLEHGDSSATTITVNSKTEVTGEHASSLSDLRKAIGRKVEVQATKQSGSALLAWKITVEAATNGHDHGDGDGHGHGQNQQSELSHPLLLTRPEPV